MEQLTATIAARAATKRPPGRMIGWPLSLPISLAEATREPVKVTEPTTTSTTMKKISQPSRPASAPSGVRWPLRRTKSSMASRAAAPPPTALNSETS